MKSLLIIGLAFGLAACSDSKQREGTINRDKESSPLSENPSREKTKKTEENRSFSNTYTEHKAKPISYKSSNFATSGSDINDLSYSLGYYTVNQNDTLMKIAFEIYGDYEQWIVIKNANSEKIDPENVIKQGVTLTFPEPTDKFVQSKKGDPYLIKRGDTLASIARNTYGSSRHWKAIWKNNTRLIKDPDKIFAGFTIYLPVITD
ncbi:LysM peptidoglycan-binding domain-containing protein [Endozoicomonas sp. GU-1]|uniref:LysM peptidoglycan-binding domain-containing protein n=1 Tax=Endozoicomonas sp. GU-1 TaxID=3009078 RepID=UPI0022B510A6|nr:LysM peptidoglycan-binding domain-containing protein [Endozoicomonas sp. GU-1]WBA83379.1 LysM peptidoglycan-binding domain-containing protein [Endozoicomonas sp. GU-1]WBA86311.1 LysM peptidoglycan-binding domain-containing protein [Endozoicomonas sp. GU-1]